MENESYSREDSNLKNGLASKIKLGQQANDILPVQNPAGNKGLLGVFELLSISWKMFQERWKKFILLGLSLIVIEVGLQFIFGLIITPIIFSLFLTTGQFNIIAIFVLMTIMVLVFSVPSLLFSIAIIEIIKNKDLGITESINTAYGKFFPYIKASAIGALIMIGFFAVYFISAALLTTGFTLVLSSFDSISILNIISWLLGLVAILVVFPVILIMQIWIFFALLAVVIEGMQSMPALAYSYELIKCKIRSIIWKFIVVCALFLLIVLGLFIMISAIPVLAIIMVPLVFVIYFIGIFTLLIFYYNIYENLKAIKINEIPENFEAKNSGKIKLLAIIGAAIIGLFLAASVILPFQFGPMLGVPDLTDDFGGKDKYDPNFNFNSTDPNIDQRDGNNAPFIERGPAMISFEANDKIRKRDLEYISAMLWRYKMQSGSYPVSSSIANLGEDNDVVDKIKSANTASIPRDPKEGYYYGYYSLDGKSFELTARLEDLSGPDCTGQETFCLYKLKSRI